MSRGQRHSGLAELAQKLGIEVVEVVDESALSQAITRVVQDPPDRLIVCGGDGTVQALITGLADLNDEDRPEMLVLGGGRTNYTARDLGTHGRPERLLSRVSDPTSRWQQSVRHSLILRQKGQPDRHGFFAAGASLDDVIRDCHHYRKRPGPSFSRWLRNGHASSAWRVGQLGLGRLVGRYSFPKHPMTMSAEGLGTLSGDLRLVLMTTLEHSGHPVNPYAQRGEGALRLTGTRADAARFWLRLPRLLCGRYHRAMTQEQGYLSGRCSRATFKGLDSVCLDGQEHDYDPQLELEVIAGPTFRFFHP